MSEKKIGTIHQKAPRALSPAECLALAKCVDKHMSDAARDLVTPGVYEVDFTARVSGSIRVAPDQTAKVPMAADPWGLLALALSKLNETTLDALVTEHLERLDNAQALDGESVKTRALAAIERVKTATTTTRRGPVTTALTVRLERSE